ncbi:hypothetical protein Clacol_001472 [Clathrus columnatus]|uniref:Uncharacterized protein n=1 Tax=Clathrus columnatus TaxID=1419009 RepID=A0AAV5A1H5_9AGAM|nr:hypothetical protein Clacol_001472 [Clathrus columnatus]
MGVCKNRVNHPRHDVVYFRNAELTSFNGCGYCKWAKRNSKLVSPENISRNPGWPGCCRPPKTNEYEYINAADWYAISKIHGIIAPSKTTKPVLPVVTPSIERRNSNPVSSSRRSSDTPPSMVATGGGPKLPLVTRETTIITLSPKSFPKPATSSIATTIASSPSRSSPPLNPSASPSTERRVSTRTYPITDTPFATLRGPPPNFNLNNPTQTLNSSPPRPVNSPPKSSASVSSSSSSRSSGSGSITQSETVTSEGFTDYLSDESEAEMQREAERRANEAEIVARLQRTKLEHGREEQEFRAARTQLASVGLQPPPAWSTGKPINNTAATKEPPPTPATTSASTPRPSRSASIYNAPMVQVYTSVRQ